MSAAWLARTRQLLMVGATVWFALDIASAVGAVLGSGGDRTVTLPLGMSLLMLDLMRRLVAEGARDTLLRGPPGPPGPPGGATP